MRRPLVITCLGAVMGITAQFYIKEASGRNWWAGAAILLLWLTSAAGLAVIRLCNHRQPDSASAHCRVPIQFLRGTVSLGTALLLIISFCGGSGLMLLEMNRSCPYPVALQETEESVAETGTQRARAARMVQKTELEGTIISVQSKEESCRFVLQTGPRQRLMVSVWMPPGRLGVSSFSELTGRRARVTGIVEAPDGQRNPGGFDYRLYLRTKDIFALMKAEAGCIRVFEAVENPFLHFLTGIKNHFSERIRSVFNGDEKTGALIESMIFGDKSLMEEELYEGFQKNGVAHLLAVSGIHVNVLYLYARRLMKGRRDPAASAVVLLFLLLYTALSGFSASSVRAALMISFSIAAVLLRRDYDMCTAAAASALLLLAGQPYRIFDTGFQLSFLAVAALAVVLPWAQQKAERTADRLKKQWICRMTELFCPLLVIQLAMAPITAYSFQNASWSSFLLNPVLIPLAGLIVPIGIAMLPLSLLPGAAGELLFAYASNCIGIPARIMIACIEFFDEHGWGSFSVASPPMGAVILFYAGLFFFCSESRYIMLRKGKRAAASLCGAGIIMVSSLFPFFIGAAALPLPFSRMEYPMVFVDVGQGDCLHIRTPEGKNVLIDGGGKVNYNVGKKILAPYLLKNGVTRIDLALITHLHADHYRGIEELASVIPVDRFGLYEGNRVREPEIKEEWERFGIPTGNTGNNGKWGKKSPEIQYVVEGDRIQLERDVWIEVLSPCRRTDEEYRQLIADETDENASSLVLAVHYKGLRVLMTGDMGFPGEEELLERYGVTAGSSAAETGAGTVKTQARAEETGESTTETGVDTAGIGAGTAETGAGTVGAEAGTAAGTGNDVLFAHVLKTGHHGSKYATSEEFLQAVRPEAAVIQVGKNNNFGHPGGRVIELFQNYGIITYRTDRHGAVLVHRIADGEAVLSDIRKEKIWHIRTEERRSMPTRPFKRI